MAPAGLIAAGDVDHGVPEMSLQPQFFPSGDEPFVFCAGLLRGEAGQLRGGATRLLVTTRQAVQHSTAAFDQDYPVGYMRSDNAAAEENEEEERHSRPDYLM